MSGPLGFIYLHLLHLFAFPGPTSFQLLEWLMELMTLLPNCPVSGTATLLAIASQFQNWDFLYLHYGYSSFTCLTC